MTAPIYVPHWVNGGSPHLDLADAFLDVLMRPAALGGIDWRHDTEARAEYFMAHERTAYTYGAGVGARTYWSEDYHPTVLVLQVRLNINPVPAAPAHEYNVCFLNRYDEQRHQLGWHADDSPGMRHDHPIAVVSLGAEREIWWRPNGQKGVVPPEQRQLLGHGSLFVMPAGFQLTHQHRIPKADRAVGPRVSLTFRKYVPEPVPEVP